MTDQSTETARDYSPFELATPQEAYAAYGELRECPVQHSSAAGGFYWLTRYEDVRTAASDSERFSSARNGVLFPPDPDSPRAPVLEMDPPEHATWRRIFHESMTPERIRAVEPKLVAIANELIDTFASAGECDVMNAYAAPLPVLGICALIGASGHSVDYIREVSSHYGDDPETRQDVVQKLGGLLFEEVVARRAEPRDDFLTFVSRAEIDGRPLTDEEIVSLTFGFLLAGHETTTSALGSLLAHVLSNPGLKERVLTDDRVLSSSVEEAVRLHPPFHAFHRTTTEPVDVASVTIPADVNVRLSWAAANRDPSVFERPDDFDPERRPNRHLGFGFGRHVCVGAPLARLEMCIGVRELLRRLPDIRLAEAVEWTLFGFLMERPASYRATFTPSPASAGA